MMKRKSLLSFIVVPSVCLFLLTACEPGFFMSRTSAEDVPRMTKDELSQILDNPDTVILDVRAATDWEGSQRKIEGAIRENPHEFESWAGNYSTAKTIVLYCA